MASYLCVKMNSSATKSYNIKSSANKPYLRVDTGFIPLTTATATGPKLMVRAGGVNYRLADFITTTTAITTGTSYLTSAKTTSTSYVTGSRASTSGTGYETRSSTSSTTYATRASTSATTYATRASTSATTYATRASTSATTYATRASTSATTYATRASTSATGYATAISSGNSDTTYTNLSSNNTKHSRVINDCVWEMTNYLNKYSLGTSTLTSRSTNYRTVTVTVTNAINFTFLNTNYSRTFQIYAIHQYGLNSDATERINVGPGIFTISNSNYNFGRLYYNSRGQLRFELSPVSNFSSIFSSCEASGITSSTKKTGYINFGFPIQTGQYVFNTNWDTYSNYYGDSATTVYRFDYASVDLYSLFVLKITNNYDYNFNNNNLTVQSMFPYLYIPRVTTYKNYVKTTATTYATRASTSATGYKTRASTSKTGYNTRASTSATGYQTRSSTSATGYLTRSSTSATTYATRSSQYTSNTSYLTQSETYETSYITASTETTMEG